MIHSRFCQVAKGDEPPASSRPAGGVLILLDQDMKNHKTGIGRLIGRICCELEVAPALL
jgi:hypothetical protein